MMLIISIVGADYALNHLMSNDVHLPQIDLPAGKKSGLIDAERVLKGVKGIEFCYLCHVTCNHNLGSKAHTR